MAGKREHFDILLLIRLVWALWLPIIRASSCSGSSQTLNVDYKEQTLFSPGYPRHYNNNMDCVWIFQATHTKTAGFGIQVVTTDLDLEIDLEATTLDLCDTDYLALFEGTPSHLGHRIGIWCGKDKKAFKSTSETLTMKFHSNGHHTGKGFTIEYALVNIDYYYMQTVGFLPLRQMRFDFEGTTDPTYVDQAPAPSDCLPGDVAPIYAARAPLYVDLTAMTKDSRCTWKIEAIDNMGAADPSSVLVVEAVSIPRIWCKNGKVRLFDGPDLTSPEVTHWCNGGEAFSIVHLSTNYATVTFTFNGFQQLESDTIQLKIYSTSKIFQQTCSETVLPEIRVNAKAVFFPLPIVDVKGKSCPVRVSQGIENNLLRIEVLCVNGHLPACTNNGVTVQRAHGDKTPVEKSCNRNQFPMFLLRDATVLVTSGERVLLKAVSAEALCSGVSFTSLATTSLLMQDVLPRSFRHTVPAQSCISKNLIVAAKEHLTVALWLQWTQLEGQRNSAASSDLCLGEFIHVYDGETESSPLLFSTCHRNNQSDLSVETRVIGTGNKMLVLFESDDVADSNVVQIVYYAVPRNTHCSKTREITVTTDVQELTSPNYPDFYPLDYDCTYKLATKNTKEVIVIDAEHTEFSRGCETVIHIYNGDVSELQKDDIRSLCGYHKNKTFISTKYQFVLKFKSVEFGLTGRWRLKIYSLATGRAGRSRFRDNIFVNLVLTVITYLFIIV